MQDYRKLDVWTKSHELALDLHRHAPEEEASAELVSDLRRAARRIPAIIVLGCEAETAPEFAQAMRDACAAADELAYRLLFARDAGAIPAVPYARLEARARQLRAMLGGLTRTVRLRLGAKGRSAGPPTGSPLTTARAAVARAMQAVRDDGSSRR